MSIGITASFVMFVSGSAFGCAVGLYVARFVIDRDSGGVIGSDCDDRARVPLAGEHIITGNGCGRVAHVINDGRTPIRCGDNDKWSGGHWKCKRCADEEAKRRG